MYISEFVYPNPDEANDRTAHIYEFTDDGDQIDLASVSYTHLTLPTICSV